MISPEQEKIQDWIIHKNVWFWGFSEIHGIHILPKPEVEALREDMKNKVANIEVRWFMYESLRKYRLYILNLDGYWLRADFFDIQKYREWFWDMQIEELLEIFSESSMSMWDADREYYYALYKTIEEKLEEKWVNLGFDGLFEAWI